MKSSMISVSHLAGCVAAGIFAISLTISTLAQARTPTGPPAGAGPPANNNPRTGDRGRELNEGRLRSTELDAARESEREKHVQAEVQAAIGHMKEDFSRMQVLRNDIARNLVARKPFDYVLIAEQTAEINKRANELNTYMMARPADDKAQDKPSDLKSDEMVGALVRLCKLIDSFTENPSLKNAATVDAKDIEKAKEDKAKADKDLLAIIKLSESIKKTSDSLKVPK
ncbi:MAG TPA: hypothetical protein VN920_01585 [Pyrinomonadaceae bacterium]|nr:hypothetical protein [Pyrinomonadaceae bacterium]